MEGIEKLELTLRNIPGSLLVVHAFAEKAKEEIRQKRAKKAKKAKEERNPPTEAEAAKYFDKTNRECVPVTALQKELVKENAADPAAA